MVQRNYRYYDFMVAAFVTVLLCSNLIGAGKAAQIDLPVVGTVVFGAGVLFSQSPTSLATYSQKFTVTPTIEEPSGVALQLCCLPP